MYEEDFHSRMNDAVPYLRLLSMSLAVFFIAALVTRRPWMTDGLLKPFLFAFFGCLLTAVFFKSTKMNGRIEVDTEELRVIEETGTESFRKKDLQTISRAKFWPSRFKSYATFQDQQGNTINTFCHIRPAHFSWFASNEGVLLSVKTHSKPIFIPTKHPNQLLKALSVA